MYLDYQVKFLYPTTTPRTTGLLITSSPLELSDEWGWELNQKELRSIAGDIQMVEVGPERITWRLAFPQLSSNDMVDLYTFFAVGPTEAFTVNDEAEDPDNTNPQTGGPGWRLRPFTIVLGDLEAAAQENPIGGLYDVRLVAAPEVQRRTGGRWRMALELREEL